MSPEYKAVFGLVGILTVYAVVVVLLVTPIVWIWFRLTVYRTKEYKIVTSYAKFIGKHYGVSITRTYMLYPGDRIILFMREPKEKEITRDDLTNLIHQEVQLDETTRGRYMITIFSPPNTPFVEFERIPEPPPREETRHIVSALGLTLAADKIGQISVDYAVKFLHYMIIPTLILVVALGLHMAAIGPQLLREAVPNYASGIAIGALITICVFGFSTAGILIAGLLVPTAMWVVTLPFLRKEDREVEVKRKTEWVETRPRPKRWRIKAA